MTVTVTPLWPFVKPLAAEALSSAATYPLVARATYAIPGGLGDPAFVTFLLAWDAGHPVGNGINAIKSKHFTRNSLVRLVIPVKQN